MTAENPTVHLIPISQINILNPRSRNQVTFHGIVSNIANIGLKKPITVSRRSDSVDGKAYDLVCGQGRFEAYQALGQEEIPAIIVEVGRRDCFLMSLVENIARRRQSPIELMREVGNLKARGYNAAQISQKIDMAKSYVTGICYLLDHGEERLLAAVEKGRMPLSVAMQIANSDEEGIQLALCEAYEDQSLRGRKLHIIRRIIEQRKINGKRFVQGSKIRHARTPTADLLVKAYRQEADRQQLLIKKARLTENQLLFIVSALRSLVQDENFLNLLRAEGLNSMPAYLVDKLKQQSKA
jgi:ParB family transcriptional regulator, chromosome partitioning protein